MKAIIEIPKGDNRRRHLKHDKSGFVDLGSIKDIIPVNEGIMPIHYGYVPDTLNENEGDEIDVLILSDKKFDVGQEVEVKPIAVIRREDGDDKVVAVDETCLMKEWNDISEEVKKLINDFFGYHHNIIKIEDSEKAVEYIKRNLISAE